MRVLLWKYIFDLQEFCVLTVVIFPLIRFQRCHCSNASSKTTPSNAVYTGFFTLFSPFPASLLPLPSNTDNVPARVPTRLHGRLPTGCLCAQIIGRQLTGEGRLDARAHDPHFTATTGAA